MDTRDWIVIGLMAGVQAAATVFLFKNQNASVFGIWATVVGTLTTAYHWIVVRDSKQPDAS